MSSNCALHLRMISPLHLKSLSDASRKLKFVRLVFSRTIERIVKHNRIHLHVLVQNAQATDYRVRFQLCMHSQFARRHVAPTKRWKVKLAVGLGRFLIIQPLTSIKYLACAQIPVGSRPVGGSVTPSTQHSGC